MMTVFVCEDSFEGVLTGVYDAWASKIRHDELQIIVGPITQRELFTEYKNVPANAEKTQKVMRSIRNKISYYAYHQCMNCALSGLKDRGDVIYRFLLLGFTIGKEITKHLKEPYVMTLFEYSRRVSNEAHSYREFLRFDKWGDQVYVSSITPVSDVLSYVGEYFSDRMPSEYFIIVDNVRKKALIHPKDKDYYMRELSEEECELFATLEKKEDLYTRLWKTFFEHISIKERFNPKCQNNHLPVRYREHMTEFRA